MCNSQYPTSTGSPTYPRRGGLARRHPHRRARANAVLPFWKALPTHRGALQRGIVHLDADAGARGHGQRAVPIQHEFRSRDVAVVVASAGRDVAGQGESGERGQGDVVGAADVGLQHASAPHRYLLRPADIVNGARLQMSAHATRLDVDDAATAQLKGVARVVGRVDALVEAYRRLQLALQGRVVDDVVVGERLLYEQQPEVIHILEDSGVLQPIGRVGIDLQLQGRIFRAHRPHVGAVLAGRDLELDPPIAVCDVAVDGLHQRLRRLLNADAHPDL